MAGVPSLADYDVIIDAGSDASDPENAVPFDVETPAGRCLQAAGQLQLPDRDVRVRHRAGFRAKGVEPDLDGDGKVEFGEAVPDADFYVAAARVREVRQGAGCVRARVAADPRRRSPRWS